MLAHMRLHKDGALLRIKSRSQKIQDDLKGVIAHSRGVVVVGRESVPVSHEKETRVRVLQFYPVLQCTT